MADKILKLREVITENLRIQRHSDSVTYVDTDSLIFDLRAKQNHAIFARRGCGKTLLMFKSAEQASDEIRTIYLNCEDFKRHSFPDVLLEILESVFFELQQNCTGWFGKKKRLRQILQEVISDIDDIKERPDETNKTIKVEENRENGSTISSSMTAKHSGLNLGIRADKSSAASIRVEQAFQEHQSKLKELDKNLPGYKRKIREFFEISSKVKFVFIQIDDLYHLDRVHQAFVIDYVHRLCKDLPLFFKVATLRHASTLYVDRDGQPFGAQERHDFQPVSIDYDFGNFEKTRRRNLAILEGFGKIAKMSTKEISELFKGQGFSRLVMAGGGVPRDVMSLFLEILPSVSQGDGKIGKDDVRISSRSNFERRIEELKQDSQDQEQEGLLKGIYLIREFCLERKTNIFNISEELLKRNDQIRGLIYRLLDYRIIHNCGSALTHKSQAGTFQAFAIDIGCYAHLRKLEGRFNEIDVSTSQAKERMRSAPILTLEWLTENQEAVPNENLEDHLLADN
ncbi:hypothetical protein [Modicisalibacter tunisiensis]|uniref:Uncharacterized protein n=1 Tax=Modicisalibacter tunisiensis TaxID=390637 RepID=A0ABS7WVU4_9GAMM|nr:hypothetical protein [Modicisalibacter tunisiensis]MBZ9566378.1 hypothetical protein [Modicisalibacter tunisiensis]